MTEDHKKNILETYQAWIAGNYTTEAWEVAQFVPELLERIKFLEAAIRKHRDQTGDDRCFLDDRELYSILPEGYVPPRESTAVMLENCKKYIASRQDPATTYVNPDDVIEQLKKIISEQEKLIQKLL